VPRLRLSADVRLAGHSLSQSSRNFWRSLASSCPLAAAFAALAGRNQAEKRRLSAARRPCRNRAKNCVACLIGDRRALRCQFHSSAEPASVVQPSSQGHQDHCRRNCGPAHFSA
jgi:hypothetical protein